MKILYLINSLRIGGAESVLRNLILELRRSYDDVEIEVIVLYEIGEFGLELMSHGISVTCLNTPRIPTPRKIYHLARLINNGNYDVIHTHLFPANYVISLLSRWVPVPPLIYTEHSVTNRRRHIGLGRVADRIMYQRFSCVIGVSSAVCESLARWLPGIESRVRLIPNGVKISEEIRLTRNNKKPQMLFVGSFRSKVKGLDILLNAITLRPEMDCILLIAGDGPLRSEMESMAHRLEIQDKVRFLGLRSDVNVLMQQADILVLPSRWEGLPMVVLESMAAACPVVASTVGGVPEIIEDGVTGWLVPPENPAALAEVLLSVLNNPHKRLEVAEAALRKVKEYYSIERMAHSVLSCYKDILRRQMTLIRS